MLNMCVWYVTAGGDAAEKPNGLGATPSPPPGGLYLLSHLLAAAEELNGLGATPGPRQVGYTYLLTYLPLQRSLMDWGPPLAPLQVGYTYLLAWSLVPINWDPAN